MPSSFGPFILPSDPVFQDMGRGIILSLHPAFTPVINRWFERRDHMLLAPEFLPPSKMRSLQWGMNDAIRLALHKAGVPREEHHPHQFFIESKKFAGLADYAEHSGHHIVDPKSYFNQFDLGGFFIANKDIQFLEEKGITVDLTSVFERCETYAHDGFNRIRHIVMDLGELSGHFGWNAVLGPNGSEGSFDSLRVSLVLPFNIDDGEFQTETSRRFSVINKNHFSHFSKPNPDIFPLPAYDGLMAPLREAANKTGGAFQIGRFGTYLSLDIHGSLVEHEDKLEIIGRHGKEFRAAVSDIVGKSNPLNLMSHFWPSRGQYEHLIKSPLDQQAYCISDIYAYNPAAFEMAFAEFNWAAGSYLKSIDPVKYEHAGFDDDKEYDAVDLGQRATAKDWLRRQEDPTLHRTTQLSRSAKQMLRICIPLVDDFLNAPHRPLPCPDPKLAPG